jgi:hypothetical protein
MLQDRNVHLLKRWQGKYAEKFASVSLLVIFEWIGLVVTNAGL